MNPLTHQFEKASNSGFRLWLLNMGLLRTVPFNKPHGIKVVQISKDALTVKANNIRANQNHIKGIHACLLATLCEYVSGLSLLLRLDPKEYRIILKNIQMTYHYQAKTSVHAKFGISDDFFENEIRVPLQNQEALFKAFTVDIYDEASNHICTGLINWQIKSWKKVKTVA
jgi:acyl-coenzyme A thioesterase PaaI-like protein